uniref:Uncharacterized protein n=1 Tax=Triticum urartu TaxID=4572 RepID=A0A8R7U548_TRIUA
MREMQIAGLNQAHTETKHKLEVWRDDKATDRQQLYSCTPASAEECKLELTLATGSSRSHTGKQVGSPQTQTPGWRCRQLRPSLIWLSSRSLTQGR